MKRFESPQIHQELISSFNYIFAVKEAKEIEIHVANKELKNYTKNGGKNKYTFWSKYRKSVIAVLYDHNSPKTISNSFEFKIIEKPLEIDLTFSNYFTKVFNDDIKLVPDKSTHTEIWLTLRQTQFRRSIAKFTAFSTEPMLRWLQAVENSLSLKYENKPFSYCLFMTKQKNWIKTPLRSSFIDFPKPIEFEKGLMKEKWIRGSMNGNTVGLAGYGHEGKLFGFYAIPEKTTNIGNNVIAPHTNLTGLFNMLKEGTCLFITTVNGDIYFALPNDSIFYKTQGRWYYINYKNLENVLSTILNVSISKSLLRLILDISYERNGALIFIPNDEQQITEIIPDFKERVKSNGDLRETIKNLNINNEVDRKIIKTSSKVDGALVINSVGTVLDVSCMIGQPTTDKLQELKISNLERFPGARSTAAWNSSLYGTSIKISEDGPITIFKDGKLIFQIG